MTCHFCINSNGACACKRINSMIGRERTPNRLLCFPLLPILVSFYNYDEGRRFRWIAESVANHQLYTSSILCNNNIYTRAEDKPTLQHTPVCRIRDSKHMRWYFMAFLTLVQLNYFLCVDWQPFVWIDYHTKQTRIRLKIKKTMA